MIWPIDTTTSGAAVLGAIESDGGRRYGFRPSSGTEGDIFTEWAGCRSCRADHAWHGVDEPVPWSPGCPIIQSALAGEYAYPAEKGPPEWWRGDNGDGEVYGCSAYRGPCSCDGGEDDPVPIVVHPDQAVLFE